MASDRLILGQVGSLFNDQLTSDIQFNCTNDLSSKSVLFFVHKNILAAGSDVFRTMFYGKLPQKNPVDLPDADEESLHDFLLFFYTGKCSLTTENVVCILYLARKYIVPFLAKKCFDYLDANFKLENVFVLLQLAFHFEGNELEKKCWQFIDKNTKEAIATEGFSEINQATLLQLVKREPLNIDEVTLYKAIVNWSEAECLRKEMKVNDKNKRDVMGNIIYHIRFASMSHSEFTLNVSEESAILTQAEKIFFHDHFGGANKKSKVWNMSRRDKERDLLCRWGHVAALRRSHRHPERFRVSASRCDSSGH
ncbi:BTB POZ domain-containing 6 [Paramuricea clavata]|uniref:BTB POZ domain-containing 6 n=1 Tax=Paramuricea clavata TaxID=317549 RepID=A0A6S7JJ86_PARCT|nr:BTB POZ domain-containing 6 [Paramuricea clavata]